MAAPDRMRVSSPAPRRRPQHQPERNQGRHEARGIERGAQGPPDARHDPAWYPGVIRRGADSGKGTRKDSAKQKTPQKRRGQRAVIKDSTKSKGRQGGAIYETAGYQRRRAIKNATHITNASINRDQKKRMRAQARAEGGYAHTTRPRTCYDPIDEGP